LPKNLKTLVPSKLFSQLFFCDMLKIRIAPKKMSHNVNVSTSFGKSSFFWCIIISAIAKVESIRAGKADLIRNSGLKRYKIAIRAPISKLSILVNVLKYSKTSTFPNKGEPVYLIAIAQHIKKTDILMRTFPLNNKTKKGQHK